MRDWPEALRVSFEADKLGSMIYYCANQVWPTDGRLWEGLPAASKQVYRHMASQVLKQCKPDRTAESPVKIVTNLEEFLKQWQLDAINAATRPAASSWCVRCGTREQTPHDAPYCSPICRDAAKQDEFYDRR